MCVFWLFLMPVFCSFLWYFVYFSQSSIHSDSIATSFCQCMYRRFSSLWKTGHRQYELELSVFAWLMSWHPVWSEMLRSLHRGEITSQCTQTGWTLQWLHVLQNEWSCSLEGSVFAWLMSWRPVWSEMLRSLHSGEITRQCTQTGWMLQWLHDRISWTFSLSITVP